MKYWNTHTGHSYEGRGTTKDYEDAPLRYRPEQVRDHLDFEAGKYRTHLTPEGKTGYDFDRVPENSRRSAIRFKETKKGHHTIVDHPIFILAGEAGPEQVDITPLSKHPRKVARREHLEHAQMLRQLADQEERRGGGFNLASRRFQTSGYTTTRGFAHEKKSYYHGGIHDSAGHFMPGFGSHSKSRKR